MRRTLLLLLVGGIVIAASYGVGFGATDSGEATPAADGDLEIHHIDVGQADATLLVTPANETILFDSGDWQTGGETVIDYLEANDIDRIDHLIASHGHAAHIGGHADVITHLEEHGDGVGAAYGSGLVHTTESYEAYLDAVKTHNVTLFEVTEGYDLPLEDETVEATVLNPPAESGERSDDFHYNSVALSIEHGEFTYLTTGDPERKAEQRLVDDWNDALATDVYHAGNHGSSSSSTEPFLDAAQPNIAIVSSALDSPYGHPHDEVLESFADRGIETYWTGVHGDIVLTTDGETLSVTSERTASTDPNDLLETKATIQNGTNAEQPPSAAPPSSAGNDQPSIEPLPTARPSS